ncbi:MAG: amidohydrolase family protein [Acidimicrobiia bacterium]|nr:amidohydrolase family protein [Acidimicrobiia bacterium]
MAQPGADQRPMAGICDTHIHFYSSRYPASPDSVLFPPDVTVGDYRAVQQVLGLERVVVVQPTTYGLDNSCQLDAMAQLGPAARGVMVVNAATPSSELERLDRLGVRGARFHMLAGGAVGWDDLEPVAAAIEPLGWHIQLQLNGRELADRFDRISALPVKVVVDHVGRFMPPPAGPAPLIDANFEALCRLVDHGRAWVKISAPYESSVEGPPDYGDVAALARRLVAEFPERMLWATNWPHPGQADPPSETDLSNLLAAWIPAEHRRRILVDNPAGLYGFDR